ncbi:MAG: isocitrate/isopropylmalate dehydrogenase family protein [Phycisphaerales bacterium]|nr:isocitrate/isopropylmalate dehydrogenase family protein [Phycisphaerales bacterium]MDP6311202.1 isocitrate/isopropylmalate dehydrogenase family protein [Phycisphaerales bacterium]MDP7086578.1 isocitrate/isopropylmalate dehydrogenase family protein [Phycisphaerales bacterium]MDP7188285.1 isocitrate/isopropylmalate dehydrogenase family protein [Phycisphaerales bacterium]MDP7518957.1 isocitrate/isopropylmalate dehydrogenase family protein [Phycisphaerales bacterium]
MAKYKIAWMPGDGVGVDVMDATRIVLDAMNFDAEYIHADIGWEFWCKEGNPLPDRTIDVLRNTDCGLFGAITSKPRDEAHAELAPELQDTGLVYFSPIVKLRQMFNLHTNMRPCKAYPGNPLNYRDDIDLVVFRENTEGMYGGVEWFPLPEKIYDALCDNPKMVKWKDKGLENVALSTRIMSRQGCENICRRAFEYAAANNRKSVTLVEKPNVLRETGGLMTRTFREVAKEYPGVEPWEANIDAICMWMIKNPQDYDVLVAENMFGDIISDLAAGLIGGLGFASSANIGDTYAVFEPTHGSAPKYVGKNVVNPMAMMFTAKLMLDWLGEKEAGTRLENALAAVITEGKIGTYDVKGRGNGDSTMDVAEEVARKVSETVNA